MPTQEDDWSDSDQEELSDVESSVLLGVPDGPIDVETDLLDAAVSRIGGLPVRASSYVKNLSQSYHTRHSCHRLSLPLIHLIAYHAINQWNYSFRCGVHLKAVQWTELYTSGDVPELVVRAKMAGKSHEDCSKAVSYIVTFG